jgi:transglutaminase-like putative cysteine protease
MRRYIYIFVLPFLIFILMKACNVEKKSENMLLEVRKLMDSGSFSRVIELHRARDVSKDMDPGARKELDSLADYAKRYLIDFPRTGDEIVTLLEQDGVDAGEENIKRWEDSGHLEFMLIDGEKRYFRWAHRNLYRINDSLRQLKQIDRVRDESLAEFCVDEIGNILSLSADSGIGNPVNPITMKVRYTITVDADVVPPGEVIRCWMPYPRDDSPRQDNVWLIASEPEYYKIAPGAVKQRSIYFEKQAKANEPVIFSMDLEFRSWSMFFNGSDLLLSDNNLKNKVLDEYTSERLPHISFDKVIRELADSLVTDDMTPYEKVREFYLWINENIIWTSAIEYGLMSDIPAYVLNNRRGDCGMQTLLFLSLCRYAGIPAKWQSGWMMHPGHVNLHDWSEVWIESFGWVPVDVSFKLQPSEEKNIAEFYMSGIDSYRMIINDDYGHQFYPAKRHPRSEPLDFQRGEIEWDGGNIYFNEWKYSMQVEYK